MSNIRKNPEWMTVSEAAALMGPISVDVVYALAHKRKLVKRKVGGRIQIERVSVVAYLAAAIDQPQVILPIKKRIVNDACGGKFIHFPRE